MDDRIIRQAKMVILVPTRARPHQVQPMLETFAKTCLAKTALVFCVDGDTEPDKYVAEFREHQEIYSMATIAFGERRRLVGTLNFYSTYLADYDRSVPIGFMGDDHRPITLGWDALFLQALDAMQTGIVYGDDGHQGAALPTQVAMTSDIIRRLGYMAPPMLTHMYCDNFWLDLGQRAGCLRYLPDVHIDHHHPSIHVEGVWDDSYRESNSADTYARDAEAYRKFVDKGLPFEVEKVKALCDRRLA